MASELPDTARMAVRVRTFAGMMLPITLLAAAPRALAQEVDDPATGLWLAETWCTSCHVEGPTVRQGRMRSCVPAWPLTHVYAACGSTNIICTHGFQRDSSNFRR